MTATTTAVRANTFRIALPEDVGGKRFSRLHRQGVTSGAMRESSVGPADRLAPQPGQIGARVAAPLPPGLGVTGHLLGGGDPQVGGPLQGGRMLIDPGGLLAYHRGGLGAGV